jgi:hypothetical protein
VGLLAQLKVWRGKADVGRAKHVFTLTGRADPLRLQHDNCFNSLVGIDGAAIIVLVKRAFKGQRPLSL